MKKKKENEASLVLKAIITIAIVLIVIHTLGS